MQNGAVWAVAAGFLLGIFLRSVAALSWPFFAFALLLSALAAAPLFFRRSSALAFVALALAASAGGMLRMDVATLSHMPEFYERIGERVVLEGVIVAEPDAREKSTRLTLRAREIGGSATTSVDARVLVIAPVHADVMYGDVVRAEGTLKLPERFDTGLGRTFEYPMFLAKDGILYELAFANVEPLGANEGNILRRSVLGIKRAYLSGLGRVLPEPAAGLAGGITVGDKRAIGEDLTETFQEASLVHIVVLSGYNMTVVINAAAHVLAFAPRPWQFALSGALVGAFVLMTGGAASATRAGAMALIATFARLTGRSFFALRILVLVAAVMTLWNPYLLLFDPGFQLSMLATAGLVLFTPLFAARLLFLTRRWGLREIAASTLGTQITVLPLLLYQNGLLSLVALPANLFALVAVPFAMLFSFFAAIAGVALGSFGAIFALPAFALLSYIIAVAQFFAGLPLASVHMPAFGVEVLAILYALVALLYVWLKKKMAGKVPAEGAA